MSCTFTSSWLVAGQYVAVWLAFLGASALWLVIAQVMKDRLASRSRDQK